jgi:hypothetical protein
MGWFLMPEVAWSDPQTATADMSEIALVQILATASQMILPSPGKSRYRNLARQRSFKNSAPSKKHRGERSGSQGVVAGTGTLSRA